MEKLGNVNACMLSKIYDKNNVLIGTCMDTPNNKAYAFKINAKAFKISGLLGAVKREDVKSRFFGLDENYHKQYVKYF